MQSDTRTKPTKMVNITDQPVPNRDMLVGEDILKSFPRLRPVLQNDTIENFFASQEAIAIKEKGRFVRWGCTCLLIICLLLILLSWRLSLGALSIKFPQFVDYVAAGMGIGAILIQIGLWSSRTQSKWLYARYAAECTRLWKYQNLLDGKFISLLEISIEDFNRELQNRWAVFSERFKTGMGGMLNFIEDSPFETLVYPSSYESTILFNDARRAYRLLRLNVQTAHFASKKEALKSIDFWTDSLARTTLFFSGFIVICDAFLVGATAIGAINPSTTLAAVAAMLAGSALTLAVISAGVRVFRSASAIIEERERYRFRQLHLRQIDFQMNTIVEQSEVLRLMERAEAVCIEELQEFLRSLRHSSYFL